MPPLHVKFVGGRLCLDFVNTVGGRDASGAVIRDKIAGYEDLLEWSLLARSADRETVRNLMGQAARQPADAAAILARARDLRETLYRICNRAKTGRDMKFLREELDAARARQILTPQGAGFVWSIPRTKMLDQILWPVSLSAADLLTSDDLARVRQCAGEDCGWLFLDISRNRRRQWCDMRDCGNRAKVRRFRAKMGTLPAC